MASAAGQSASEEGRRAIQRICFLYHARLARLKAMVQAGACRVPMQMGWHATEAAGSSSTEASHSQRTDSNSLAEVWLQHAWKLPASPHLAVAAEGMSIASAHNRHCIKDAVERTAHFIPSAGSMELQACQRSCTSFQTCDSCSYKPVSKQGEE